MSYDPINFDLVLQHLPSNELQRYLFKRLDLQTLKSARCVSKNWQMCVDPMLDFHVEFSDANKKYVEQFGTNRVISSITATTLSGTYPRQGVALNAKMLRLTMNFDDDYLMFQKNHSHNVGISRYNFRQLMNDFYFIEKLHIASLSVRSFGRSALLSKVDLPNVKEMIITFFDSGFHQLMPFLENRFPSLNSVNIANVAEKRMSRPAVYTRIFSFISRHAKTLHEVTLIFPEGMMDDKVSRTNIYKGFRKDHNMPVGMYFNVKKDLEKLKLKRLIWDISTLEGIGRYDLGSSLLKHQSQLRELLLDNLRVKDIGIWNSIGEILDRCSSTLSAVTVGGCMCIPSPLRPSSFPCAWLRNCKNLETLEMVICGIFVSAVEDLPKEKLRCLNLGHMLQQEQIEYIALNLLNLETWVLPQKGSIVNLLVPKINRYLFEVILHLPKLTKLNVLSDYADVEEILLYAKDEVGIRRCTHMTLGCEKTGNLGFHICRQTFRRNHSELPGVIEKRRNQVLQEVNMAMLEEEFVDVFIRNLLLVNHNVLIASP